MDLETYEVEQLWKEHLVLLVLSTYENGSAPDSARYKSMFAADMSMTCLAILLAANELVFVQNPA